MSKTPLLPCPWQAPVTEDDQGQTLAAILRTKLPGPPSWNQIREAIRQGRVFFDGEALTDPALRIDLHGLLEIRWVRKYVVPPLESDRVLFLDTHLIVVNKPDNLLTHAFEEGDDDTLEERIRLFLQKRPQARKREPVYIVHRLDRGTSGVLVFARLPQVQHELKMQFRFHSIFREYVALVSGHPKSETIDTVLLEDRGDGYRGSIPAAHPGAKQGKQAITHVEVLETFERTSLIACRLETGRTHQIRVHLSERGNPLVGDDHYQKAYCKRGRVLPPLPSFPRPALHARSLGFVHPIRDEDLFFETPPPDDFLDLLDLCRRTTPPGFRPPFKN